MTPLAGDTEGGPDDRHRGAVPWLLLRRHPRLKIRPATCLGRQRWTRRRTVSLGKARNDEMIEPQSDHEFYMRRCLESAALARDRGNTVVGCVIVLSGRIIGHAAEALPEGSSVTGHAEVLA